MLGHKVKGVLDGQGERSEQYILQAQSNIGGTRGPWEESSRKDCEMGLLQLERREDCEVGLYEERLP